MEKEYKKILIHLPNWLGDIIMSYPVIERIRDKYPDARITALGKKSMIGIFNESSVINETISIDNYKSAKKNHFDCAFIFPNSFISAFRMFKLGIKERIGYDSDMRGLFLTKKTKRTKYYKSIHTTLSFMHILSLVGINEEPPMLKLPVGNTALAKAKEYLTEQGVWGKKIFAYGIGATNALGKLWDEEYFAETINMLHKEYDAATVFIGTPGDREIAMRIEKMLNHKMIMPNLDLSVIAGILHYSQGFIGNDSGAMHLASAIGIPTVGLYFATPAYTNHPRGEKSAYIEKHENCDVCGGRECTYEKPYACKKIIKPQEVISKIKELL